MRKFIIITDKGNEYVALMSDASAKEIAHKSCVVAPLKDNVHHNPIMDN